MNLAAGLVLEADLEPAPVRCRIKKRQPGRSGEAKFSQTKEIELTLLARAFSQSRRQYQNDLARQTGKWLVSQSLIGMRS